MNNYVAYIDTDSIFIMINAFLKAQGIDIAKWDALDKNTKIKYILKLAKEIEKQVNKRSYEETQVIDYNSSVEFDDFSIKLKQEIICAESIFFAPKMYAYHVINEEGNDVDDISAKGIEIIKSTAPSAFKAPLKDILKMLLMGVPDSEIKKKIFEYRTKFYDTDPDEMSVHIGVNNIDKYIKDGMPIKGTPGHVCGVAYYHKLLKELNIENIYEPVREGDKCKFVYLKNNKYRFPSITYHVYPKEFINNGILPCYDTMIEKYFLNKIALLLKPIDKEYIIDENSAFDIFF